MAKVISLTQRIKNESTHVTYHSGKYPIFEGKVIAVSAQIISKQETSSIIDYIPKSVELPEVNLSTALLGKGFKEYEQRAKESIQRVIVPFSVSPEIVNTSDVIGHIKELNEIPFYSLEIVKDNSISDDERVIGSLTGFNVESKYAGFQYLVPLNE